MPYRCYRPLTSKLSISAAGFHWRNMRRVRRWIGLGVPPPFNDALLLEMGDNYLSQSHRAV